ncbi:hypothetical protein CDD83_3409 [Cordyceps sp. RAO-2017]|nr:hypothetical protein CDD83_3409 [Cordyceps sp. RAO-2017]
MVASLAIKQRPSDSCHKYVIVSTRGTFERPGSSIGFRGMIKKTLATVPGGIERDVHYLAAPDMTQITTLIGSRDIQTLIKKGLETCPSQTYALLGYSQGATVVLEALRKFRGTSTEKAIKAVLFIGNPYQVPNQASTVDEDGGNSTRASQGVLLPLIRPIGLTDEWVKSGKALNICYRKDLVCNGLAFDTLNMKHLYYGFSDRVQKQGSDFLISKLADSTPHKEGDHKGKGERHAESESGRGTDYGNY